MKQIQVFQGEQTPNIVDKVNEWLRDHDALTISDIQYSYDDYCSGVMIVYEVPAT
jgi:hypothetical protein